MDVIRIVRLRAWAGFTCSLLLPYLRPEGGTEPSRVVSDALSDIQVSGPSLVKSSFGVLRQMQFAIRPWLDALAMVGPSSPNNFRASPGSWRDPALARKLFELLGPTNK
jgi:hypothetical protein